MTSPRALRFFLLLVIPTLLGCGSSSTLTTIAGTVSVDGAPVDVGTIHFQSAADSKSTAGGAVAAGAFQATAREPLAPGEYSVVLQAFRKTGRTLNDPQKGKVEETADVALSQPSQRVTITADNAESLSLNYAAAAK